MDFVGKIVGSWSLESDFFFFLFLFLFSSLFSVSIGYVATFIYPTTQVYHVSIRMVSSSHRELEVGSKPACNGTHELSELRSRDRGFLTYFVPFELSDFGLVHTPLSFSFRFFLYREMEGGLEGFIFSM